MAGMLIQLERSLRCRRWLMVLGLAAALGGCRFAERFQAVPGTLMSSRQLSLRGISAIERADWSTAEQLLAEAVETCPFDPEARYHYAQTLWHRGEQAAALAQIQEATRLSPDDPKLLVSAARMQLATGDIQQATLSTDKALDLNPHLPEIWRLRAELARLRGDLRQAVADNQRALATEPECPLALNQLAQLYRELNEPQRALATLQALADVYPPGEEPLEFYREQGLCYRALNRPADAARSFSAAIGKAPQDAELNFLLAEAELASGRAVPAVFAAQAALAVNPSHAQARALLEEAERSAAVPPKNRLR